MQKKKTPSIKTGITIAIIAIVVIWVIILSWPKAKPITPQAAWQEIEEQARDASLNPGFVYAIAFAESSLRPHATSGHARGIMQLSEAAWKTVSKQSYQKAWNWQTNIKVGVKYLAYLKKRLQDVGKFNYPRLAASYRYGFGRVRINGYAIERLPKPRNKIYQKLFTGTVAPVAIPKGS